MIDTRISSTIRDNYFGAIGLRQTARGTLQMLEDSCGKLVLGILWMSFAKPTQLSRLQTTPDQDLLTGDYH
jgi:hypothetical protein